MRGPVERALASEVLRYGLNGVVATLVHYSVLRFNIEVLDFPSVGVANAVAAVFGIGTSFIGSRYFVFRAAQGRVARQGVLFLLVYGVIALLHGSFLYLWTDRYGLDYTIGFILATGMQMAGSFVANKFMVFR
ncbi:GtrA family protein [Xanthomonas sp. AM6]|uniref:GtrA family protein n=1 Tax=Xanthomonas sp. AM6 TaxID=2982531 RepID=UPI0021DA91CD|nr:GtrA family protein [Xanthomonas sp. AM6]UYB51736.1 GtrA family protein [Xanthomonas sp. AM6]